MIFFESVKLAIRNIRKRKKRTALTMLGVFIGIAAVVALVSLGQGLSKSINDQFEKVGADKIIIQAKEVGFGGEFAPGQLTQKELDLVSDVNGVVNFVGQVFRAVQAEFSGLQRTVFLLSYPDKSRQAQLAKSVQTWEIADGRLLTHKDRQKLMVGYNLGYKNTFGKNIRVGDKIIVETENFEVVGILKRTGDPTGDSMMVASENDVRRITNESKAYSMIFAQSAKEENPDDVAARIEKTLRRDRHQKEGKEDFEVQTSTELIESFNTVLNLIQFVFIGIAAISLLVGGIGIMNTMYTAVLERTREIGVMKAIGAKNSDVLSVFLIESALLGIFGGAIGVIIGVGISKAVEIGANSAFGPGTITAVYPEFLIFGALLFSGTIGALSGILPARRASKLKPVDALRNE